MRPSIDRPIPNRVPAAVRAALPILAAFGLLAAPAPAFAAGSPDPTAGSVALVPSSGFCGSDRVLYVTETVPGTNWIVQITDTNNTLQSGVAPTSREAVKASPDWSVTLTVYTAQDMPIPGLTRTILTPQCSAPLPPVSASQVCSSRAGVASVSVSDPGGASWEIYRGTDLEAEGHTSLVVNVQNLAGEWTLSTIDATGQLVRPQRIPLQVDGYCGSAPARTGTVPNLPRTGMPGARPTLLQEALSALGGVLRRLAS